MTTTVSDELIRAFYAARLSCDPAKIGRLIDDDIDWSISGPVDVLPYAGQRRGKQTVLKALAEQGPTAILLKAVTIDDLVIEGDTAITRTRVFGTLQPSGRTISYQCAQLVRFRDGKVVLFRAIIDSFDATEQILDREIAVSGAASGMQPGINRVSV